MHLASLSRVNFGTRSLKCENSEMGYCFPYSMLCLARLEQRMRPLFFFCFLLPLQYSGLACHILRLDHDSHQPHNTNLKEQQVRLFLFPSFVHTWQGSVLFYRVLSSQRVFPFSFHHLCTLLSWGLEKARFSYARKFTLSAQLIKPYLVIVPQSRFSCEKERKNKLVYTENGKRQMGCVINSGFSHNDHIV